MEQPTARPQRETLPLQPLLREREVAGILGVSVRTLQQWRRSGDGPPFLKLSQKKRGMVRYDPADVETFMLDRKVGGGKQSDGNETAGIAE